MLRKQALFAFPLLVGSTMLAVPAYALPIRVFVSGAGSDSGGCAIFAPCRSFAYAINQVAASGEIAVLDTAGYGAVTINKAVSIVNAGGVEGGIATAGGGTAITVAAGASDNVSLRGLTLDGNLIGQYGIVFTSGGNLDIDNCVIRDFTGTAIAISAVGATASIVDTITTSNGVSGITVTGASNVFLNRVTSNNNAVGSGVAVNSGARVRLVDTVVSNNATGVVMTGAFGSITRSSVLGNANGDVTLDLGSTATLSGSRLGIIKNLGVATSFVNNSVDAVQGLVLVPKVLL